ncbi:MAG: hypothetical protein PHF37_09695, partial [Phycisphaerae bacterium]|nr:hypothetical protein [Phycisphaerae bacterium]
MKKLLLLIIVLLTVVTAYGKTTRIVSGSNTRVYTAEADPVFDESDANTIDANDINNWNGTYTWWLTFDGNETDPCFAEWLATFDNNETDPCYKLNTYAVGMNQDVNTTASPQFAGVDAGNLYSTASQTYLGVHSGGWGEDFICNSTSRFNAAVTINPNYLYLLGTENGVNKASFLCGATGDLSITCTGGDIDFGDGNLTTTGTIGGVTMVSGDITSGGVLSLTD